jgi:hypothetical protein
MEDAGGHLAATITGAVKPQSRTAARCNATRIMAVAFVDLCRQRRLHMPGNPFKAEGWSTIAAPTNVLALPIPQS